MMVTTGAYQYIKSSFYLHPACYADPSLFPLCQVRPRQPFGERPKPNLQFLTQTLVPSLLFKYERYSKFLYSSH